jgi:hypothetical protein
VAQYNKVADQSGYEAQYSSRQQGLPHKSILQHCLNILPEVEAKRRKRSSDNHALPPT